MIKVVSALRIAVAAVFLGTSLAAAELHEPTTRFYERYIENLEKRRTDRKNFLLIDFVDGLRTRVQEGELFVEERRARSEPPEGLIHHWEGAVFIPKARVADVVRFVQDYDNHKKYYGPEVVESKTLEKNGNDFKIRLRLVKKKIITVVLETEHTVHYKNIDAMRWESASRSTKISEVNSPNSDKEKQLPPGRGGGFIWRMDSFWRFMETPDGVFLECSSISLSRDIPFGMGRLIRPIVEELPQDSLKNVLAKTRQALKR